MEAKLVDGGVNRSFGPTPGPRDRQGVDLSVWKRRSPLGNLVISWRFLRWGSIIHVPRLVRKFDPSATLT